MAPDINDPGGDKNDPDEIRDGVVSDSTRFPGGFIDEKITQAGAAVGVQGQFQVNNAAFDQPFNVSTQVGSPAGLAFKPDGSRLYVVDGNNADVVQYSLSTAFDVSTASFDLSFDVSTQDGSPAGLAFKPDGTQLYVTGVGTTTVYQYSLSTDFDVSSASLNQSFDVSAKSSFPQGLVIKPDGSRLYVVANLNTDLLQYNLSTTFDVSTASFTQSFDVSSQDGSPQGLTFKPDGSQFYITGTSNRNAYQYSLSTNFDVSTASFVRSFDVSPQDTSPEGLAFKPDGSQLYITGSGDDNVYQYFVGIIGGLLE